MVPDITANKETNSSISSPGTRLNDIAQTGGVPAPDAPSILGNMVLPDWGDIPSSPMVDQSADSPLTASDTPKQSHAILDNLVKNRLAEIQATWSQEDADTWVYDTFLPFLVALPGLKSTSPFKYLDWLVATLKRAKVHSKTTPQYMAICKTLVPPTVEKNATRTGVNSGPGRFSVQSIPTPAAEAIQPCDPFTNSPPPENPDETAGYVDNQTGRLLCNYTVDIDEEVESRDADTSRTLIKAHVVLFGKSYPFTISAEDFASNRDLAAKICSAAGVSAVSYEKMDLIRAAIGTFSGSETSPGTNRRVTITDFGWNETGDAYLVPSGMITKTGFTPAAEMTGPHVDLQAEDIARRLDLTPLPPTELERVKLHVVEDLLTHTHRRVTYSLLGSAAVAVLAKFAPNSPPFGLWVVGPSGAGKSFAAKLFTNFFGSFPVAEGQFASWTSTGNYLQRQGYYHKDAPYLIDDYKAENIPQRDVIRLLQAYADRTSRGRLNKDATAKRSLPIRGLLVATGEDVTQHVPSAVARNLVIPFAEMEKDLSRGMRCEAEAINYNGVTADFIRHILASGVTGRFSTTVATMRQYYYQGVAGQQNGARIAGNLALLAAAFAEFAEYFSDVWPEWESEIQRFAFEDLMELRNEMTQTVGEQQPSAVFWETLLALIDCGEVLLDKPKISERGKVIGKAYPGLAALHLISTELALEAVNTSLKAQCRPVLQVSIPTLISQLRRDGRLVDGQGIQLPADGTGPSTFQVRIDGKPRRNILVRRADLIENEQGMPPLVSSQSTAAVTGA